MRNISSANPKEILNKPIKVWIAITKDGKLQMFSNVPKRGKESWIGNFYVNSLIYENIKDMINNSSLSWASEPEFLELSYVLEE